MIPAVQFHAGRWGQSEPASQSGRPLPGRTPPQLVSQLIYRVLGPYPADVRPVLDLHGMCGRPAVSKKDTATRNDLPLRTLRHLHEQVLTQAHHTQLDPAITAAASTRSGMFDDHQGRRVIATTLGVPPPPPWTSTTANSWAVHTCLQALAVLGPQRLDVLISIVERTRRGKNIPALPPAHLAFLLALHTDAQRRTDRRWETPAARQSPLRHQQLADAMGTQVMSRERTAQLLISLGYTPISAHGQSLDRHPLIQRIGADQYALAGRRRN